MNVDCQYCGDRVPHESWPEHLAEHQSGARPVLPTSAAFERHAAGLPTPEQPLRGVPVRLWVTSIRQLDELTLTKLPEFGKPFEHQGKRYQLQSMQLADVVDIVLFPGNSPPRPLTHQEVSAARLIPTEHSCDSNCLRCWALRTGQL